MIPTLWDYVLGLGRHKTQARAKIHPPSMPSQPLNPAAPALVPARSASPKTRRKTPTRGGVKTASRVDGAAANYERMTREMLATHGVRVRRWRTSMSGIAWTVTYQDGKVVRLIESPKPKGPMSAAIFLHEIGHHAIGIGAYKPRCLEEYHAWRFALEEMARQGIAITERVEKRRRDSLRYAVGKAMRRGIRDVPAELQEFVTTRR